MKYIFVTGAPGSKWSSVVKNIYFSDSIDQSDYSEDRMFTGVVDGNPVVSHIGAYWDPGMEFGGFFDKLSDYSKEQCELEFDRAFTGKGVRIIKSHCFSHHIDFLKRNWPDCPVVTVHKPDAECLAWWLGVGGFDLPYPHYRTYYRDVANMTEQIRLQNYDIVRASAKYTCLHPHTNVDLCTMLKIKEPSWIYKQTYSDQGLVVSVI